MQARAVGERVALHFAALLVDDGDLPALAEHLSHTFAFLISFTRVRTTRPSCCASKFERSISLDAVPPMWKVRMVSCVPGSPMDCAAMMPTVSPS